jgi:hypothetical protein
LGGVRVFDVSEGVSEIDTEDAPRDELFDEDILTVKHYLDGDNTSRLDDVEGDVADRLADLGYL